MRRIVTLVNQVALATTNSAGLQAQMVGANQAATRYQAENLQLKQTPQHRSFGRHHLNPSQLDGVRQYSSISIQQLMVQRYRWAKG
ncbi:unnamed protein product [Boreogadus saida]